MGAAHAVLSPSAAHRWIQCPASIRMEQSVPEQPSSVYAREGTAAHVLCEMLARYELLEEVGAWDDIEAWRAEYDIDSETEDEMRMHAEGYVEYLRERLEADGPDAQLLLEERVPSGIDGCWGTSDAIIVSPTRVESVDFKYGMGVRVEAVENPQLRLYGVGALDTFGDLLGDVETVRLTVYQPRVGHVASEELPADELRAWRDSLLPIAEEALGDDAPFGPSESACRWCPAAGSCLAQMEWATARDFGVPAELMSDDELAKALDDIPGIKQWCAAVEDYALDRAYSQGKPIPGFKVVRSAGRRSVVDDEGLIEAAVAAGYDRDDVARVQAQTIGRLEKLLEGDFDIVAGPFVRTSEGKPSLVSDTDRRPAIDPETEAAEDFA